MKSDLLHNNYILFAMASCLFLLVNNCQRQKEKVVQNDVSEAINKVEGTVTKVEDPITKANWENHPKIKAIQKIIEEVEAGMTNESLKTSTRNYECETHGEERIIAKDMLGTVRKYKNEGGSEDSRIYQEYYYDKTGKLRFVYIDGGAFDGTTIERQIYYDYDENQKIIVRIWEVSYTTGMGYFGLGMDLIDDPTKAFEAELPSCNERVE